MNRFKRALKFAIIICFSINLIGLVMFMSIAGLDTAIEVYKRTAILNISHLLVPCFLSAFFYQKDMLFDFPKAIKAILKSGFLSFLILYVIVYFHLKITKTFNVSFWNIASFFNGTVAFFIAVLSALLYTVTNHKSKKRTSKIYFDFAFHEVMVINFIISSIYILLLYFLGSNMISLKSIIIIVFLGLFATFVIYNVLNFIKTHALKKFNENLLIVSTYLFNIFILPFAFFLLMVPYNESVIVGKIFQAIIIIGPYFLMLTLAIHVYYNYVLNIHERNELVQSGIKTDFKYQQLKAQLSPHFLFNNISVLTGLIEENPKLAVEFSEKLSNIYRYFLEQEHKDLVLLNEELTFGNQYLDLLKVRFENALEVSNKLKSTSDYYILPLALQQIFENIVKHNEISDAKPMNVEMIIEDDYLIISNISNPKKAINLATPTGLQNIRKRYSYFTERLIVSTLEDNNYTIKLPLLKAENT